MIGSLGETSTRSVILQEPIQATIDSNYLKAYFLYNVGDINIEVYNSFGELIYETNVDTSTQSSISIDVTEWDSDFYEIRFLGSTGNYIYWTFEIE